MEFNEYQDQALDTDLSKTTLNSTVDELIVPLLGLAGEVGELLTEYKKQIRDGKAHTLHKERVKEELGDLLWYLANCASKYGLALDEIATTNLVKTRGRWKSAQVPLHWSQSSETEAFPRYIVAELHQELQLGRMTSKLMLDGAQIGATLTDNAYTADGYRFHDVFHLSYAGVLGWSPVIRALLKRKRRSDATLDEVEDGGRAVVIEEGVSALVFAYARNHQWLEGVDTLDYELLRTIRSMTSHLEIRDASPAQWQEAIFAGFRVWRGVMARGGGRVKVDTLLRSIDLVD